MKLVIDVSYDYYMACKEKAKTEIGTCVIIANGIPLPEHHGDLIDRNDLIKDRVENDNVVILAKNAPTIIKATEERRGVNDKRRTR